MENRFEESFNELGLIYESFFVAQKAGGQKDSVDSSTSYKKGTFSTPQGSVNQFRANMTLVGGPVGSDEEAPEPESDPIILKIEELQKEAEEHGQDFALLQLIELKKFIEES